MAYDKAQILKFIERRIGTTVKEDSIVQDLGIDGLDAFTLIEEIAVEYDVDMTGFNFSGFFLTEYKLGNIFLTIFRVLFNRKALKKGRFTVNHLIDVINKGKWFDP